MILRPQSKDFKIIGFYLGKIIIGMALFMVIPMAVSFLFKEINPFFDFLISFLFCISIGLVLHISCYTKKDPKWSHGMTVVSSSWVLAALLGAIPLYLSGHWNSFFDSFFDAMSGFTTTGFTLVQDLSHMSYGHNLWRHLMMFIGGQGIVVVILSFFVHGASGAFRLYVGEARNEKVLPNIRQTARFIWTVSFVYLICGTLTLGTIAFAQGMPLGKAMFHGLCIFMAAFDTGGFTPQEQNVMYYHSLPFEIVTMIIMVLGAFNFRLHYTLWTGQRKEIWRNFEVRTLFISILMLFSLVALGLSKMHVYPGVVAMFRKGFYQLISAHTGTGYSTIYSSQFISEWGALSLFGIICAMALGGCLSSTTGGIKALRLGIIARAFANDIKQYVSPESSVFVEKIHHIKEVILTDRQIRSACLITIAYIVIYFMGGVIGMVCGYPFLDSFFESVSASANVGLSCGITQASMPLILKIVYVMQMWIGRLEFISVFALIGFVWVLIRGE